MSHHERTPLLPSSAETHDGPSKASSTRQSRSCAPWVYIVAHCIAIAITADIAEYLSLAPKVRLFESIICADYYRHTSPSLVMQDGSVPEHLCKVDPVQDGVASILGWHIFFESFPAILLPIPFGYLADTYGRKWIAVLALLGYTLSWAFILFVVGVLNLPLQFVWLSPLFFLIGGGSPMATTMLTTIVADVAPADKRSSAFFYGFTSELIAECFVPPVTAILMARSPWLPLLIALALLVLCTAMTLALPETLHMQHRKSSDLTQSIDESPQAAEEPFLSTTSKRTTWTDWMYQMRESFSFATHTTTIAALIFTFFMSKVGRQSIDLLLQYVSKRYGWNLSNAGLLFSLRAAVNILLFTIILPYIATCTFPKSDNPSEINPTSRNLAIARGSIILMIVGSLILSVSFTPGLMILGLILYTLGTGSPLVVRSLTTTLVEKSHAEAQRYLPPLPPSSIQPNQDPNNPPSPPPSKSSAPIGRLYALLQIMEGIGNLIAGPGMAWLFRVGIRLGHGWLGLPFMLASLLFAIVGVVLFVVRRRDL